MAIVDLKTPKTLDLPTPERIKDSETKGMSKKLMSALDDIHKKIHEDLKTAWRILAGSDAMANALNMGSNLINNVTDPISNQDAATKKYVDDNVHSHQYGARAYLGTIQQNLVDGDATKVLLDTENWDLEGEFASNKFTATVAGYYQVNGMVTFQSLVADKGYIAHIYKNGVAVVSCRIDAAFITGTDLSVTVADVVYLDGVDDFIELYATQHSGADAVDIASGSGRTYMSIIKVA